MPNQEYPSLNGIAPSWADIVTSVTVYEGEQLETIDYSAVNWSRTVEVGAQRGASGGRVMARTVGSGDFEATASYYMSGYRKLLKALMAKAPTRGNQLLVGLVGFDIEVQHTPPGEAEIYMVRIKGCRLLGDSFAAAEGPDAQIVELTLNPIEICNVIDGKEVVLL